MSDRLGFVVVEWNQASGQPEDLSSTILHPDLADAHWERDLKVDEARENGRRERYMVCAVAEPEDEDQ